MKFGLLHITTPTIIAVLLGMTCAIAPAQTIDITADAKQAVPFYMSGFTDVAQEVLKFDLEVAGFKFVPADRALFTLSGANQGQLEGRLFDSSKSMILGRAYASGEMRARAHALADEVVFAITKHKGIFRTKIAFRIEQGGQSEVAIADFDGHNVQKVTQDASMVQGPSWVPGAFKLVYTSYYKAGFPFIYLQDLGTGDRQPIARYPGANFSPAVSPDGRRMAMILSKSGTVDLYVSNIDGSNLVRLTHNPEDESSPCWSPDSQTICFVARYGGSAALFTISPDGGEPHRLSTINALNTTEPDWSPDGSTIVFTSLMGSFNLFTVPARGGVAKLLVEGQDPSWAPNSRTVIFTRQQGERRHLCLLDVPTKTVKDVRQLSGSWSQPSWSR